MAQHTQLVDPRGRPVSTADLRREFAAPQVSGARQVWTHSIASGLTPARLAQIMQSAAQGSHNDYLTLAEEIEERDHHYRSVLSTRKLAISGLEVTVEAASDDEGDVELAGEIRALVKAPEFGEMVDDLLDGIGKGYSAVEIDWQTDGPRWTPLYSHRDPRFFQFDRETKTTLRIRDESNADGIALPPYKFLIHQPRLKTGLPIRRGLARLAAWGYLFKAFSIKDWAAFLEVFGMPMRIGRYGASATDEDIRKLVSAVVNLGTDAAAVIPLSMQIEFQDAVGGGGGRGSASLFEAAANWWDKQTSKAVLGQTASTEGTPGKLGNEDAQADVRRDILRADAQQLANTLNRDLVRPFIGLNFGPREAYPRIVIPVDEPEDLAVFSKSMSEMVPLGFKVAQSTVRKKFGLPEPEEGEEVLSPLSVPPEGERPAPTSAQNVAGVCPVRGTGHDLAVNAPGDAAFDALDEIEAEALAEWEEQLRPIINPLRELVNNAASYEELKTGLDTLLAKMDDRRLVQALAKAFFMGRGVGDAENP